MKHFVLLIALAITCILAAVAHVYVSRMIEIYIFSFKAFFIIPVGATAMGMLGASGAILAARYVHLQPTIVDAMLMMVFAAATMILIYYVDYATFVLDDGRRATDLVDFPSYVHEVLTKSHVRLQVGRRHGGGFDSGELGSMGYARAAIEFVGFLIGGAATFYVIKKMWRCLDCGSYLRALTGKAKCITGLTLDEASALVEMFKTGNLETVRQVVMWTPPDRPLDCKGQKAFIGCHLYGPKCRTEVISTVVCVFKGKKWEDVPALKARRDLPNGSSLRDLFFPSAEIKSGREGPG